MIQSIPKYRVADALELSKHVHSQKVQHHRDVLGEVYGDSEWAECCDFCYSPENVTYSEGYSPYNEQTANE